MREIKFRAWDAPSQSFIEDAMPHKARYYKQPLMQYTGLKDKNGIEIYEGDIIAFWNTARGVTYRTAIRNKVVEWLTRRTFTGFSISENTDQTWEVIGNIYENPELITNP